MTWARIETSRALTGSSQTMNFGLSARARAMPMRWRCPPENSCGYRSACSALRPTVSSSSNTRFLRSSSVPMPWMRSGSPMMFFTRMRGFSEA